MLADHEAGDLRLVRLGVLVIDPVVAYQGIGHGHDLRAVTGVGGDFLVAGHRGVEDDLAAPFSLGGKAAAREYAAVFERQCCSQVLLPPLHGAFVHVPIVDAAGVLAGKTRCTVVVVGASDRFEQAVHADVAEAVHVDEVADFLH